MTKTKAKHEKRQLKAKIEMNSIEIITSKKIQYSTISRKEYILTNIEKVDMIN